jgi:hypothetical protein
VTITQTADHNAIQTVAVSYHNYSDTAGTIINGTESVTENRSKPTTTTLDWHSNLTRTGKTQATKVTSPEGFHLTIDVITNIFQATGTLTTTVDGQTYSQPMARKWVDDHGSIHRRRAHSGPGVKAGETLWYTTVGACQTNTANASCSQEPGMHRLPSLGLAFFPCSR